jgi:hypothetical protein
MDYPGKVITKTQVTPTQTSASGNWTLDDQAAAIKNNNWPVALVPNPISKSLRFNSADSTYLNRTPAGSGTLGVWTFSFWVKRAALSTTQTVYYSGTTNQRGGITFTSGDLINCQPFNSTGANASWTSTAVYRDPSAWYHVVIRAFSSATGNSFGGVELALYINGVQQTFTLSTAGTPTGGDRINDSQAKQIGQITPNGGGNYLDAYLTEFNFIDGQALTPSSFGMTNPQTGQWIPLKYSGTYGTNGFYLNFKDATSTTTLGLDYSGNANNWTANNFSVTAGAGNDSLTDVPTPWIAYNTTGDVGGVIRGNYCTMNVLDKFSSITMSDGNLKVQLYALANGSAGFRGTLGVSSGKWYWEVLVGANQPSRALQTIGVDTINTAISAVNTVGSGAIATSYVYYQANGNKINNGSQTAYGATYTTNDVIGVALDMDAGTLTFYKNGASQGQAFSGLSGTFAPSGSLYTDTVSGTYTADSQFNFGQRPFAYTPPTGFRSLCTTNLPATAIGFGLTNQGDDYFNIALYAGNGAGTNTVTTNFGFTPDFIWIKNRTAVADHALQSSPVSWRYLSSNTTGAEGTAQIGSLADNSFLLGTANSIWNASSNNYAAWCWKASGSTVSNTAGSITSTVSANTTAGFSVVTYTGTGANATVGHGLGAALNMIILKRTNSTNSWQVYHSNANASPASGGLFLNTTDAFTTLSTTWNNTVPTSTVFSIGTAAGTNASGGTYVAYCFAAVPGYSAFGSYTGNGSADGPFVYTGFRPRYLLVKNASDGTANAAWIVIDSARSDYNQAILYLVPNTSGAEASSTGVATDFLSNGFKIRNTSTAMNANTNTIIYAAFAESPFQFANAR